MLRTIKYVYVALFNLLALGCASTNIYIASTDAIDEQTEFVIIRSSSDSLDLASVFATELSGRGYSTELSYGRGPPEFNKVTERRVGPSRSTGSGFFVSSNGIALTNAHVVDGADRISVLLRDGSTLPARIIAVDYDNDVCVLAVSGLTSPAHTLPLVSSRKISLGEPIHVIGYPLSNIIGTAPRVTEETVSSVSGFGDSPTYFQISAPIQPGNSGGPVLNKSFGVIGIATSKLSDSAVVEATGSIPQNVNFALKIDYARLLLTEELTSHSIIPQSLDEAANATFLVIAETDQSRNESISTTQIPTAGDENSRVIVRYVYDANYDLFHWQLRSLTIDFVDPNSGEVLISGRFTGDTSSSAKTTAGKVIRRMLDDAGL